MKSKLIFSVLAFTLCFALTSFAQEQEEDMPSRREQFADNGGHRISGDDLFTKEQKEAFKTIRLKSMKQSKALEYQLRELKAHQETLLNADNPDIDAIYSNIDKMSDIKKQLAKIHAKAQIEMMSYLTDEQKMQMPHFREMGKYGMPRPHRGPSGPGYPDKDGQI
jgi:Spy/CpxP family protein refolding chaperone